MTFEEASNAVEFLMRIIKERGATIMGMDLNIYIAKSYDMLAAQSYDDYYDFDEIIDNQHFYDEDGQFHLPTDKPIDAWYARKFHDLVDAIPALQETFHNDTGIVRLKKETLKAMIEFYAFHSDYFDGFSGLPRLCQLYQMYDRLQANGLNLYFANSY